MYYSKKGVEYEEGADMGPGFGATVASSFFLLLGLIFASLRGCCTCSGGGKRDEGRPADAPPADSAADVKVAAAVEAGQASAAPAPQVLPAVDFVRA